MHPKHKKTKKNLARAKTNTELQNSGLVALRDSQPRNRADQRKGMDSDCSGASRAQCIIQSAY